MELNTIYNQNCLEGMQKLPDKSIDLILTDPPYGTTEADWDKAFDINTYFDEFRRLITDRGAIVITAVFPLAIDLIHENRDIFKYDAVWMKSKITNFANAKNKFMRGHENILIFSKGTTANGSNRKMVYNPQGLVQIGKRKVNSRNKKSNIGIRNNYQNNKYVQEYTNYPNTILNFKSETNTIHGTQKPLSMFQYLVKTFSNEGDTVLDPFIGSGTTAVACINTNRKYIGFEMDKTIFDTCTDRVYKETKF